MKSAKPAEPHPVQGSSAGDPCVAPADCGAVCRELGRHCGSCEHFQRAPDPCDLGALIASAIAASGIPRADVVRSIATAQGRTVESVSAALSKATGRPDAGAELLRAVCVATGRRVTTEPLTPP